MLAAPEVPVASARITPDWSVKNVRCPVTLMLVGLPVSVYCRMLPLLSVAPAVYEKVYPLLVPPANTASISSAEAEVADAPAGPPKLTSVGG